MSNLSNNKTTKEYCAEYYSNNKEKYISRNKEYYENNKEKLKRKGKEYRQCNKIKIREKNKEYYKKNKKKIHSLKCYVVGKWLEKHYERKKECRMNMSQLKQYDIDLIDIIYWLRKIKQLIKEKLKTNNIKEQINDGD